MNEYIDMNIHQRQRRRSICTDDRLAHFLDGTRASVKLSIVIVMDSGFDDVEDDVEDEMDDDFGNASVFERDVVLLLFTSVFPLIPSSTEEEDDEEDDDVEGG